MKFYLGLKEMSLGLNTLIQNTDERLPREHLIPTGHVTEMRTEQNVCQHRSAATHDPPPQRSIGDRATRGEAASEHAVVTLRHTRKKSGHRGGVVTETRVDFEDPVSTPRQCLTVAANIRIDDARVFRTPDDLQTLRKNSQPPQNVESIV